MDMETLRTLQAYGFFILLVFMCVVLYGYLFHLRKSEKTGRRNYEQYGDLAINDSLTDRVIEPYSMDDNAKKETEK